MKENPNTIYLACGDGNEESIKEKLKKYNIDEKRFVFTGHVKAHIYGWVIDVWPDSFPLRGGQAKGEFKAKGGFFVTHLDYYKGQNYENMLNQKIEFQKKGIEFPNAKDIDEYIYFVNKAIKDEKYRKEIGKIQKENSLQKVDTDFMKVLDEA
jgi:hypothetical protein